MNWKPRPVPAGVRPGDISTKKLFALIKFDRPQQTYIETGTYLGNGIAWANTYFNEIHSIEIHEPFYTPSAQRFKDNSKVHVHLGDSRTKLAEILDTKNEPCFIFLDAHCPTWFQNCLYISIGASCGYRFGKQGLQIMNQRSKK